MAGKLPRVDVAGQFVLSGKVWNDLCDRVEKMEGLKVAQGGPLEMHDHPGGKVLSANVPTANVKLIRIGNQIDHDEATGKFYRAFTSTAYSSYLTDGEADCIAWDPNQPSYATTNVFVPLLGRYTHGVLDRQRSFIDAELRKLPVYSIEPGPVRSWFDPENGILYDFYTYVAPDAESTAIDDDLGVIVFQADDAICNPTP